MQSAYHTLPSINGVDQKDGAGFRAREVVFTPGPHAVRFSLDIAPAYPAEARVARWRREVTLDRRRREVVLAEEYALAEVREPVRLHFVTPLGPDVVAPGRIVLSGYELLYDRKRFDATVEEQAVEDGRLQPIWGGRLFRIILTARARATTGAHRIVVRAAR